MATQLQNNEYTGRMWPRFLLSRLLTINRGSTGVRSQLPHLFQWGPGMLFDVYFL